MGNRNSAPGRERESNRVRIAVVGDVHGAWDEVCDEKALRFLDPDVVLFVGDFGDGDVALVETISRLNMPKAVILGNHDCFGSNKMKQLFHSTLIKAPYQGDCTVKQLEALGDSHVGFSRKDFPSVKLSIVGSRPFSCGGDYIFNLEDCTSMYGVKDMQESADKITSFGLSAPRENMLVFLGHNGPKGLGSQAHDICGSDFTRVASDNGDSDLEEAIKRCRPLYRIPLVVFGHMHKSKNQVRNMVECGDDGTVYVNAAVVPRERHGSTQRNFTMVELTDGKVSKVTETWVEVPRWFGHVSLAQEIPLYPKT